jgi:thioredoxin-like negative regulator of GroEL
MKSILGVGLLVLGLLVPVLAQEEPETPPAEEGPRIEWRTALDATLEESSESGKPIMAIIVTAGSSACAELEAAELGHPKVVEAAEGFLALKVDGNKHRDWIKSYKVRAVPTVLFLGADGGVLEQFSGFKYTAKEIFKIMKRILTDYEPDETWDVPWTDTLADAFLDAEFDEKPLFLFFFDDSDASVRLGELIDDRKIAPLARNFVWGQTEFNAESEEAQLAGLKKGPAIAVLVDTKPVAVITEVKDAADLRSQLKKAIAGE